MILYISTLLLITQAKVNWDYLDHGDDWMVHASYKSSCSKTKNYQSPVDLGGENTITIDVILFLNSYLRKLISTSSLNMSQP